jgi:hypothetical protein
LPDYLQLIGELTSGVEIITVIARPLAFVQLFVKTSQELENQVPAILKALKIDGLFGVCYPKGSSTIKTDG